MNTIHVSEMRLQHMLDAYWELYSRVERNVTRAIYDDTDIWWYCPSCPEVTVEG